MLDNFTDEQLQKELEHRQKIREEEEKPKQLETLDLQPLREICQEYVDDLERDGYVREDFPQHFYEVAMVTIFGKGIWKWVNAAQF